MNGWLSPIGEFTPCAYAHHYATACKIIDNSKQLTNDWIHEHKDYLSDEDDFILKKNYIKIFRPDYCDLDDSAHSGIMFPDIHQSDRTFKLTPAQKQWCDKHFNELTVGQQLALATKETEYYNFII